MLRLLLLLDAWRDAHDAGRGYARELAGAQLVLPECLGATSGTHRWKPNGIVVKTCIYVFV